MTDRPAHWSWPEDNPRVHEAARVDPTAFVMASFLQAILERLDTVALHLIAPWVVTVGADQDPFSGEWDT